MFYSIDYYSFTIALPAPPSGGMFDSDLQMCINLFCGLFPDATTADSFRETWESEKGRGFYSHRFRHDPTDITMSYGERQSHIFIELAGKACNNLDGQELLEPLIHATGQRATRIDFAVDIPCEDDPRDFVAARGAWSFKSSGSIRSASGRTEYVGGRSSERMARVYRYESPHPRSHLLRVEAEYKGDAAKAACQHLRAHGLLEACLAAHSVFRWQHKVWVAGNATASKIPYKHYHPANASTLRWLYGDVVSALRKAVSEDLIDLDEWLKYLREGLK